MGVNKVLLLACRFWTQILQTGVKKVLFLALVNVTSTGCPNGNGMVEAQSGGGHLDRVGVPGNRVGAQGNRVGAQKNRVGAQKNRVGAH